jgi:hypothetical protein
MWDEILLDLHTPKPLATLLEVRLECRRAIGSPDEIFVRKLIPAEISSQYSPYQSAEPKVGEQREDVQNSPAT